MKLNSSKFNYKLGINLFDSLFKNLLGDRFGLSDMTKYGINTDLDKITFVKNILKKKDYILDKNVLLIDNVINKKISEKVKDLFFKGKKFVPESVMFKYSGRKNEDDKKLIEDPNKLVTPADSKVFRIKNANIIQTQQDNDFIVNETGEKNLVSKNYKITKFPKSNKGNASISSEPGLIEIVLQLDLDVETVLSPEEMLEESKTKSTFRIIGDMVSNFKNKLNCGVAKRDFNKNLKEIGEIFDRLNPPPAMFEGETESEIPEVSIYSNTVKVTPNVTIIKNKIVPYGKEADFESENMVTIPEKQEAGKASEGNNERKKSRYSKRNKTVKRISKGGASKTLKHR